MPRVPLEIATGFYNSASEPLAAQRCINWVPIVPEATALNNRALIGTPGLVQFASVTGVNRGSQQMDGLPYFVNGSALFSVDENAVATDRGFIEGTERVSLANNGTKLCIVVPGGKAYVYDKDSEAITEITDTDYQASDTVSFKDGFFIFTASDGDVFFISALNDPSNIDPLDFGTAEIDPDKIIASHINHNELFILGEITIELFQNIGGSGFPFQRIPGANIQKGCHAKFSIVNFDNTFTFIGGGLNEMTAIWKVAGSSAVQKISTCAIDNAINEFTADEVADSFSWVYAADGSYFVGFTFESTRIPSKTFVYDATASALSGRQVWHERQTGVTDNRWRVNSIVNAHGKLLVGDSEDGRIGEIDKTLFTEYGNLIFRQKTSAPFSARGVSQFWGEIELTMESGVGLTTGQGSNPLIRHDYSDDGARTFSNEESREIGKIGEYQRRSIWRRRGRIPAHRVVRFTMTDPVKPAIIKLEANAEMGTQ